MSAIWRAAVDWHATTLNPITSSIFSLLADAADAQGYVRYGALFSATLTHQSRTDDRTVRKALETLLDGGFILKAKPGIYLIDNGILPCPENCLCPNLLGSPRTRPPAAKPSTPAEVPPGRVAPQPDVDAALFGEVTVRLQGEWRRAFKTEAAPGLLQKTAKAIISTSLEGTSVDLMRGCDLIEAAFGEYLRRVKDPMYLNLEKFASTWRVYLEPKKGKAADENAADFARVFEPSPSETLKNLSDSRRERFLEASPQEAGRMISDEEL